MGDPTMFMTAQTIEILTTVFVMPCIIAGIWLLRLEGRVNAHELKCDERQRNLDERHRTQIATLQHMDEKLDRLIERQGQG